MRGNSVVFSLVHERSTSGAFPRVGLLEEEQLMKARSAPKQIMGNEMIFPAYAGGHLMGINERATFCKAN